MDLEISVVIHFLWHRAALLCVEKNRAKSVFGKNTPGFASRVEIIPDQFFLTMVVRMFTDLQQT